MADIRWSSKRPCAIRRKTRLWLIGSAPDARRARFKSAVDPPIAIVGRASVSWRMAASSSSSPCPLVAAAGFGAARKLRDEMRSGDTERVGHDFHREASRGGDGNCQTGFFFPSDGERPPEHLDFHGLAAQKALQFTHALFEITGFAGCDDIFIGFDGDLTALGHKLPPLEQQAWRDAMQAGNGRYRHPRLAWWRRPGRASHWQYSGGGARVGDDFNARGIIGHRRKPRSSWLRQVSGRNGGRSRTPLTVERRALIKPSRV